MTPTPLPVVVTDAPGTDWLAQLLDGFLGAIIAAGVSVGVALIVVNRQHRADRDIARELAAREAAEAMTQAALNVGHDLGSWRSQLTNAKVTHAWLSAFQLKWPSLLGYVEPQPFLTLSDALQAYEDECDALVREASAEALDEATGKYPGDPERGVRAEVARKAVTAASGEVLLALGAFRSGKGFDR